LQNKPCRVVFLDRGNLVGKFFAAAEYAFLITIVRYNEEE